MGSHETHAQESRSALAQSTAEAVTAANGAWASPQATPGSGTGQAARLLATERPAASRPAQVQIPISQFLPGLVTPPSNFRLLVTGWRQGQYAPRRVCRQDVTK